MTYNRASAEDFNRTNCTECDKLDDNIEKHVLASVESKHHVVFGLYSMRLVSYLPIGDIGDTVTLIGVCHYN